MSWERHPVIALLKWDNIEDPLSSVKLFLMLHDATAWSCTRHIKKTPQESRSIIEIVDHFVCFIQSIYWANFKKRVISQTRQQGDPLGTIHSMTRHGTWRPKTILGWGLSLLNHLYVSTCFFCNRDDGAASLGRPYSWAVATGIEICGSSTTKRL